MNTKPAYQRDKLEIPTSARHQKQTLWQIWVPLGLAVIIFLGLGIWAAVASAYNLTTGDTWMALSVVWLVLIYLVIGLVVLAVLAGGIFLITKLLDVTPTYSLRFQTLMYKIQGYLISISNQGSKAVIAIMSAWAGVRAAMEDLGLVDETK